MAIPWTELAATATSLSALALAVQDDEDPIERLTRKVRRAVAGEDVDFDVDRDDELRRLADAIDALVATEHEADRYRRELYEITADRDLNDETKIRRALALGRERLGLANGLITAIDEPADRYEVEMVEGDDFVTEGTVTNLSETFCRKTVDAEDDILAIYDPEAEGYADDPGHREWDIASYVGAKLVVEDELYGTLCFVDDSPRDRPVTADERAFVDLLARWISHVLERRRNVATLRLATRGMDAAPVGITITDPDQPDNPIIRTNPAFEALTGYDEAEVRGRNCRFLQGPETDPERVERLRSAIDDRVPTSVELRNYRKDGTEFWNRVSVAPVRDASGDLTHFVGFQEDVTDRVERARELAQQRTFMDDVLDAIDDVFYVLDQEGTFRRWNDAFRAVTGYDDETIPEMHALDFFPEEEWPKIAAAIEEVFETGSGRVDTSILTADGETIEYEFVAAEIENPDGQSVLTGIGRDVTARKRYERELERTTDMLQQAGRIARFGGWELDVRTEPPTMTWTDEMYDIHGVPQDVEIDVETAIERYHPEDREYVRSRIERALETGVGYDVEVRTLRDEGVRWVRALGETVTEDGEVVKVHGAVQDISEQKEREFAFEALHDSTRGLLEAEDREEAAETVVAAAESALDVAAVALFRYDEAANQLVPAAVSTDFETVVAGGARSIGPQSASPLWHAFVTDSPTVLEETGGVADDSGAGDGDAGGAVDAEVGGAVDAEDGGVIDRAADAETTAGSGPIADAVDGGLAIPVGDHGIFLAVAGEGGIGAHTRRLAETLIASAEAALDRLAGEARLRERDAELEARNERLRRQIRVNETLRSVDRSLIGATNQAELETDVCEQLAAAEGVAFAWIGGFDAGEDSLRPRAWAGETRGYLDGDVFGRDVAEPEPAVVAADSGEPTVVENVARNLRGAPWRRAAVAANVQSALAVPLALEDHSYGVLAVYASEPGTFGDLERTVYAELGESIANAIATVTTRQALHADAHVALTLGLTGGADPLAAIAAAADCEVRFEGLAAHSREESRLFVRTSGAAVDAVTEALDARHAVQDHRLVRETDEGAVFELTVGGPTLATRLVRHGGRPRSIVADPDGTEVAVDVPVGTDVRAFVEMLRPEFDVELLGRREVNRSLRAEAGVIESILEDLTDRQREVLETAYLAGFFESPRDTTGEELAEMLDVSQPTVNRHLRLAERRIMSELFDGEPAVE